MNTKERIVKLQRYLDELNNRKTSPVPAKHLGHPETYHQFLNREIEAAARKLDSLKLEVTK